MQNYSQASEEQPKPVHQLSKINNKHYGRKSIIYQENEIMNFELLSNAEINSDKYNLLLADIMKKPSRNIRDNQVILRHLMQMTHFINMIRDQNIDLTNMLIMISDCIRYRYEEKDRVLFKVGDKGDKFYIILKGEVEVLVCNEIKFKLTEGDYIMYLCKLRRYEEYEILHKVILMNKTTFTIDFDNFDYYLKKCVDVILDILNLPCLDKNERFDDEEILKVYNSSQNKKFTTKAIIYALLCKEAQEIYNQIFELEEITLISNYFDKVNYLTPGLSRKSSIKSLGSINKLLRKDTVQGSLRQSNTNVISSLKNNNNTADDKKRTVIFNFENNNNNETSNNNSNFPNSEDMQNDLGSLLSKKQNTKLKSSKNLESIKEQSPLCNSDSYIARYKIDPFAASPGDTSSENLLLQFNIIEYNRLLSLATGSVFGEKALMASCQRRTATIITSEATHLGILSKEVYSECIREVDEKIKKTKITTLLSTYLLREIHRNTFDKKYYNFFIFKRIARGERIIIENKTPESVYFIKEGEFDITLKTSLNELTNLTKTLILGGMNKNFSLRKYFFTPEISQKEIISAIKTHSHAQLYDKYAKFFDDNLPFGEVESDVNLAKYLTEKRIFKISQITKHDIIGFEDFICNDKNAFSVQCTSQKGFYFTLDFHFLKSISGGERISKEFYEKFVNTKKEFLIDRLINIRKMYLEKYKKNKIFETQRTIEIDNLVLEASQLKKNSNLSPRKTKQLGANFNSLDQLIDEVGAKINEGSAGSPKTKKENEDYRLTFIKNLQELREKNDKAQMGLKATLSPKRKVFRRKIKNIKNDYFNLNANDNNNFDFNANFENNNFNNYEHYNNENNNNKNFNYYYNDENANYNYDENYQAGENENNFGYDSIQNYQYNNTMNNYNNYINNNINNSNYNNNNNNCNDSNYNNVNENKQIPNINFRNGDYQSGYNFNQVKSSTYMTNINSILNKSNQNIMIKTTYDFKEKPNLITNINESLQNAKGNLLYTSFPILKVDYSKNFYISNSKAFNKLNLHNSKLNLNDSCNKKLIDDVKNKDSSKSITINNLDKNADESTKLIKLQNTRANLNHKNIENITSHINNVNMNNKKENPEANLLIAQNEINENNSKEMQFGENVNFLPKIKLKNNTTYGNSLKHPMKKNELFSLYNTNLKKNIWNSTNNFKVKSFSNLTNLYDTTASENLNTNFYSTKNNPNNYNISNNINLSPSFNFISSKNVLVGTNHFDFSNYENFNNINQKKFDKKNLKQYMHPTISTEENEIFSNLCGYNKYELKMEEKSKENNYYFSNKDETENLKKNLNRKVSWENSYYNTNSINFNNSSKDLSNFKVGINSNNKLNGYNNTAKINISNSSLAKIKNPENVKSPSPTRLWNFDSKKNTTNKKKSELSKRFIKHNTLNYFVETKNNMNNLFYSPCSNDNLKSSIKLSKTEKNFIQNFSAIKNQNSNSNSNSNINNKYSKEAEKKFDNYYLDESSEQKKDTNEINIFNSTKDLFRRANSIEFNSKAKNKKSKKYLSCKYNINGTSLFPHYDPDEFMDEQQVCSLIEHRIINLADIDKLNLIPNFNKSYLNRLRNLDQNKFNNPLLESFKPENPKEDTKFPEGLMDGGMDQEMNKQGGNSGEREEDNDNENNKNNLYRESEINCSENEINGEMNEKCEIEAQQPQQEKQNSDGNNSNPEAGVENQNDQGPVEFEEYKEYEEEEEKDNENYSKLNNVENEKLEGIINSNNNEEEENENKELGNEQFANDEVGELQGRRENNHNSINNNPNSEKMLTETIASENYLNNLGNSTIDNHNNFHKLNSNNIVPDNYFWDQTDTRIPYHWGTRYSNMNIAPKKFLNLNNNLANDFSLKSKLLADVIIDQHKLSEKRKEQLICKKESKALARTQSVFSKFIQKRKGNVEKK